MDIESCSPRADDPDQRANARVTVPGTACLIARRLVALINRVRGSSLQVVNTPTGTDGLMEATSWREEEVAKLGTS